MNKYFIKKFYRLIFFKKDDMLLDSPRRLLCMESACTWMSSLGLPSSIVIGSFVMSDPSTKLFLARYPMI